MGCLLTGLLAGQVWPSASIKWDFNPGVGAPGPFQAGVQSWPGLALGKVKKMDLVEEFLASNKYAASTKDSYRRILVRMLAEVPDPLHLSAAGLVDWIASQGWGNSQQCVAVGASRKFLRWRYGTSHPALSARIKAEGSKPQRTLMPEKALELLMWFDTSSPHGARDLAMAAVMLDTGLRASEICRLQVADTDLERMLPIQFE